MTHRSSITLADGRKLFYYDRVPGRDRSAPDLRANVSPSVTTSQLRWNPIMREYSVIAGHRQARTYKPSADLCPLDPSCGGRQTEIPCADYEVVVFENRFPSFSPSDSVRNGMPANDESLFASAPAIGRCEVVCFTSTHTSSFAQLSNEQVETVIDAWVDRTTALSALDSIEYVFCFENRGDEVGVTLSHPHGQIYGYPFVPPRFKRAAEVFDQHLARTGRCLECDLLDAEICSGSRIVIESDTWVGYVPFAARWPYEVRLVPRRHVADLPGLGDVELKDLARIYPIVLRAFDTLFETRTPYIAGWQQAPVHQSREAWHLAAEIFTIRRANGKLKYLAGSESGAAAWINDVTPEDAAARLRDGVRAPTNDARR